MKNEEVWGKNMNKLNISRKEARELDSKYETKISCDLRVP